MVSKNLTCKCRTRTATYPSPAAGPVPGRQPPRRLDGQLPRTRPIRPRRRKKTHRPLSTLTPILLDCPECQHRTYADYNNYRTISTLDSVFRLTLTIRRCPNPECSRFLRPYRPEAESHFALPYHEFGLDVMALVGRLRYAEHRSIPEIYRELTGRGIVLAEVPSPTSWTATMS